MLIDRGIPTAVTNNNHLTEENIIHIVDEFVSHADVEHFARCVPYEEIVIQDYNLSVSSYVEQEDYCRNRGVIMSRIRRITSRVLPQWS